LRFLCKAVGQHGTPAKITIDGSGANSAAIENYNQAHGAEVEIRQVKYPTGRLRPAQQFYALAN
jgi:putative transposase